MKSDLMFNVILHLIGILVNGLLIWGIWNQIMPQLFKLPEVNLWQSILLYILSQTLFTNNLSSPQ